MRRENFIKNRETKYKVESVEEYKARGGVVKTISPMSDSRGVSGPLKTKLMEYNWPKELIAKTKIKEQKK